MDDRLRRSRLWTIGTLAGAVIIVVGIVKASGACRELGTSEKMMAGSPRVLRRVDKACWWRSWNVSAVGGRGWAAGWGGTNGC